MERFLSKVNKIEGGCWQWTGNKDKENYGLFWYKTNNRRAHRISYILHNGEIPEGLIIRHKCDNPSCVNPEHLESGTQKDNIKDMNDRGRRKGNIKLTNDQIIEIKRLLSLNTQQREIAKQIGVSQGTVCQIKQGKRWA